jgi:hypothetical protein
MGVGVAFVVVEVRTTVSEVWPLGLLKPNTMLRPFLESAVI